MLHLCLAILGAAIPQDDSGAREALRNAGEKLFQSSGYTFEWRVLEEQEGVEKSAEEAATDAREAVGRYARGHALELVRNGSSMFRRNSELVFQGKTGPWKMIDLDKADEIAGKKNIDAEAQRRRSREASNNFDRERFIRNLVRQANCPVPHEILHAILGSCVPVQQAVRGDAVVFSGALTHYVCRLLMGAPPGNLGPQLCGTFEAVQRGGMLEKISFVIEIRPSPSDEPGEEEKPPRRLEVEIRGVGRTSVDIPPEAVRLFTEEVG